MSVARRHGSTLRYLAERMKNDKKRASLINRYQHGDITDDELAISMMGLMASEATVTLALDHCHALPGFARDILRPHIEPIAENDYFARWFSIGDHRSEKQIELDALQHQEFLQQNAQLLLEALESSVDGQSS